MNSSNLLGSKISGFVLATLALGLAGCPQDGGVGGTVVDVSLAEYRVTPDTGSAPSGAITFRVSNEGAVVHEFLVVRTDLAPDALPAEANGAYDENAAGTVVRGELGSINPGQTRNLTLNLEAGSYVLLCNMVNQGFAHYSLGMRTAFTVTPNEGEP